jgi:gluconate 2-dehydrogenase subunit 3-like protein
MASDQDEMTRREALKRMGVGAGVIASLPILGGTGVAQSLAVHDHSHGSAQAAGEVKPYVPQFFNELEYRTVTEMSDRIIPSDDSSPGAEAARVHEYIDLVVNISTETTKQTWRDGLAAINKKSRASFGKDYPELSESQQIELLKEISKNERSPQTVEERFFRVIKNATIDGYYTSEIGIHKELKYKGNSYLKEFTGCTHPEHQS